MKKLNKDTLLAISFLTIIASISIPTLSKVSSQWINEEKKFFSNLNLKEKNLIKNSNDLKKNITSLENDFNDNVYKKNIFVELNGYSENLLNKKIIHDLDESKTIIKDTNGYLHFKTLEKEIPVSKNINLIKDLNDFCNSKNIKFLYTQAPLKTSNEQSILPIGIKDYSNNVIDELLLGLSKNSVPYLDLRDEMKKDSIDYKELFLKTDHHWNFEAGFWAYSKIIKLLNETFNMNLDNDSKFTNLDNYYIKRTSSGFVGSQGKRVGQYYTDSLDYLNLLLPKFETNLSCSFLNNKGIIVKNRSGNFYDTFINKEIFESNDPYSSKYESFLDSNNETHIINNLAPNNKKLLFIKDSFARPVSGYMSLNFKETRLIDRRTSTDDFYEYINQYNPDVVIMLYSGVNFLGYSPTN